MNKTAKATITVRKKIIYTHLLGKKSNIYKKYLRQMAIFFNKIYCNGDFFSLTSWANRDELYPLV